MNIAEIAYQPFLGKPLIFWGGLLTFISFYTTALLAILIRRQKIKLPFTYHIRLAYISLFLGLFHAVLGILLYIS